MTYTTEEIDGIRQRVHDQYFPKTDPVCSCCGIPRSVYEREGHDSECFWFGEEDDLLHNEVIDNE